jgi:LytS/YehU family sensor histidine kinase
MGIQGLVSSITSKKYTMKSLSRYYLPLAGIITGAMGGYLYYYFIGCADGTCMITSRPLNSTLYGAVLGGLLFSMFQKDKK